MTPATLNDIFFGAIERFRSRPAAMRARRNGRWTPLSHEQLLQRVFHLHCGLRELGLTAGDRMAILSENRPEWAIADYACLTARLADVPIYPTLTAQQACFILRNSGAKGIFVSSHALLAEVLQGRSSVPDLQHIVVFDDGPYPEGVIGLQELEARGAAAAGRYGDWMDEARQVQAGDLATIIYTSGTTGDPKGVMLSHGNITSNVVASLQVLEITAEDECLSFLPLSHIFERMVGHYTMLQAGTVINYATSMDALLTEMGEVRPTILASVPRMYEKIYTRTLDSAMSGGVIKRAIFEWARATGEKRLEYTLAHRTVPGGLAFGHRVADLLVFSKLRARLGGRLRFGVSGGAPLNPDICRFFIAAGLPVLEGYGLTETSPVMTVNTFSLLKPGTVGRPIPGVEVTIANDGEILTRGPNVMLGYFNLPEATAQAIDAEGWFHTGDVGLIDADGCLKITDRKKDLIVTAGGKKIAPQPIEALLKTNKFFLNAVMLGDKRKFPIMLLVPNQSAVTQWLAIKGRTLKQGEDIAQLPDVQEKLEREARKSLRDLARFEMPKKFLVLPHDFSIERGELTPKMSVRRKVVEEHYQAQIENLYVDA
ncbi:MAG: long-chain fatty acid--CoA ligase [Gemmatimonadota bacterium]